MSKITMALALWLGATAAALAQSQSGGNFGTPSGGATGFGSRGYYPSYTRHRASAQPQQPEQNKQHDASQDAPQTRTPTDLPAYSPSR